MSAKLLGLIGLAVLVYVGAYVAFRQTRIEVWQRDRQAYVIFPEGYGALL